jgi:hypothetical protein
VCFVLAARNCAVRIDSIANTTSTSRLGYASTSIIIYMRNYLNLRMLVDPGFVHLLSSADAIASGRFEKSLLMSSQRDTRSQHNHFS